MLFHSTLRKELARSFGATFVVLLTVVMTMMLIRTLGQASKGSVNPQDVMLVMGYSVVGHLPTILTLSLFISIVGTLSRLYRDSEMVVWLSSGRGLLGFVSPVLRFAWPILLIIVVLALVVWPWTNQKTQELKDIYENRGDLERVTPGQFQESAGGHRVFFVEKDTREDKTGKNVFLSTNEKGKQSITSARQGRIETSEQGRFLVLQSGQRLERRDNSPDIRVSEFAEYAIQVSDKVWTENQAPSPKTQSTLHLLQQRDRLADAELAWRFGLGLAAVNLCLLALAITSANPRVGKSHHLMLALLAFVVYYNMLNLSQSWVGSSRMSLPSALAVVHLFISAIALAWLWMRHHQWSPQDLLSRMRKPKAGGASA